MIAQIWNLNSPFLSFTFKVIVKRHKILSWGEDEKFEVDCDVFWEKPEDLTKVIIRSKVALPPSSDTYKELTLLTTEIFLERAIYLSLYRTMVSSTHSVAPVRDIMNESFHEHRPSFRTLVSKFDKKKPQGSFSYNVTKKNNNIKKLIKEKSIRQQFSESFANTSFGNSLGSGLDLIGEEDSQNPDVIMEEDEELHNSGRSDMEAEAEDEMAEILAELVFEPEIVEELQFEPEAKPEQAPERPLVEEEEEAPKAKKKKKKRTPNFVTEPFVDNYVLGEEVSANRKEITHTHVLVASGIQLANSPLVIRFPARFGCLRRR